MSVSGLRILARSLKRKKTWCVSPFVSREEEEFASFESTYEPSSHGRKAVIEHAEQVLLRVLVQQLHDGVLSVISSHEPVAQSPRRKRPHIADEFQVSRAVAVDQAGPLRRFVRDPERARTERDPVRVFEVAEEGARGAERVVLLAARGEGPEAVFRVDDQAREVLVAWTRSKYCLAPARACACSPRGLTVLSKWGGGAERRSKRVRTSNRGTDECGSSLALACSFQYLRMTGTSVASGKLAWSALTSIPTWGSVVLVAGSRTTAGGVAPARRWTVLTYVGESAARCDTRIVAESESRATTPSWRP